MILENCRNTRDFYEPDKPTCCLLCESNSDCFVLFAYFGPNAANLFIWSCAKVTNIPEVWSFKKVWIKRWNATLCQNLPLQCLFLLLEKQKQIKFYQSFYEKLLFELSTDNDPARWLSDLKGLIFRPQTNHVCIRKIDLKYLNTKKYIHHKTKIWMTLNIFFSFFGLVLKLN